MGSGTRFSAQIFCFFGTFSGPLITTPTPCPRSGHVNFTNIENIVTLSKTKMDLNAIIAGAALAVAAAAASVTRFVTK